MADEVISSLGSHLSRWLGKKKSQSKMDVTSGCAFSTWLKALVAELILAAQQTCSWHQLLLYPLSAEIVGKSCSALGSSGSVGQRGVCSSCQPSCLHSPLLRVRPTPVCPAHQACWGVCACLTWAGKAGGVGLCPASTRDHVSSCIAL